MLMSEPRKERNPVARSEPKTKRTPVVRSEPIKMSNPVKLSVTRGHRNKIRYNRASHGT